RGRAALGGWPAPPAPRAGCAGPGTLETDTLCRFFLAAAPGPSATAIRSRAGNPQASQPADRADAPHGPSRLPSSPPDEGGRLGQAGPAQFRGRDPQHLDGAAQGVAQFADPQVQQHVGLGGQFAPLCPAQAGAQCPLHVDLVLRRALDVRVIRDEGLDDALPGLRQGIHALNPPKPSVVRIEAVGVDLCSRRPQWPPSGRPNSEHDGTAVTLARERLPTGKARFGTFRDVSARCWEVRRAHVFWSFSRSWSSREKATLDLNPRTILDIQGRLVNSRGSWRCCCRCSTDSLSNMEITLPTISVNLE